MESNCSILEDLNTVLCRWISTIFVRSTIFVHDRQSKKLFMLDGHARWIMLHGLINKLNV